MLGLQPSGRVRMQACRPQILQAVEAPDNYAKGRWIISSSALYLLEQIFKIENYPSLHMRQRLAADLGVSARQVDVVSSTALSPVFLAHASRAAPHCLAVRVAGQLSTLTSALTSALTLRPLARPPRAGPGVVPKPPPTRPQHRQGGGGGQGMLDVHGQRSR